ncbi:MAG: hypothetical protein OXD36_00150, partial [Rhodobacter sp.]|nr:hypothetical protein [Rhodobacter sp.]
MTRFGIFAALAACGGGGGGNPGAPANGGNGGGGTGDTAAGAGDGGQPAPRPDRPAVSETHRGGKRFNDNGDLFTGWYAAPRLDLPRHGRGGLDVDMPERGGGAVPRITFGPSLAYDLEPVLRFRDSPDARARLEIAENVVWLVANEAYLQWTRHLDYDPGPRALQVGDVAGLDCGPGAVACYSPADDRITLGTDWLRGVYANLWSGNDFLARGAAEELFFVLTHEAGHQFGYENPRGSSVGCGDGSDAPPCHAPVGSGSVMSYDHLPPPRGVSGSLRYNVTERDIRHIPDATWNGDEFDRYTVSMSGAPSSIDRWGVWIEHRFEVSGRTDPGGFSGGNLAVTDEIHGRGWVRGRPSGNALPPTGATWSGEDNFLGVDLSQDYLGALLRADANLRYTFGASPDMTLRVSGFEAHYDDGRGARWHDHNFPDEGFGDFTYRMDCTRDGCSGDV